MDRLVWVVRCQDFESDPHETYTEAFRHCKAIRLYGLCGCHHEIVQMVKRGPGRTKKNPVSLVMAAP